MLGNAIFRVLVESPRLHVTGTVRREESFGLFPESIASALEVAPDLLDQSRLERLINTLRPDVVINCTGVRRASSLSDLDYIRTFAVLPQRVSLLCGDRGVRFIQISSDGVFSGKRGGYGELDVPDADDLYGVAKVLGEVAASHCMTIRTSIIGPELTGHKGLLEWFLSETGECRCYTKALFSGFPTVVLASIIRDFILPNPELCGIYHVASRPISKFDLLSLVASVYSKTIRVIPDDSVTLDRTLDSRRFDAATGYSAPDWHELVTAMCESQDKLTRV